MFKTHSQRAGDLFELGPDASDLAHFTVYTVSGDGGGVVTAARGGRGVGGPPVQKLITVEIRASQI